MAEAPVEHGLEPLDHFRARAFGDRQPGIRGHRQHISGQRLGPVQASRWPVPQQPVIRLIRGDFARQRLPLCRIAQRNRARQPLFEAVVGIARHERAHPFERRGERVVEPDIDGAAARDRPHRRLDRDRRIGADARERARPDFDRVERLDRLIGGDLVDCLAVRRFRADVPAQAVQIGGRGQIPRDRHCAARRDRDGQRLALRNRRGDVDGRGDSHRLVRSVAQREPCCIEIAAAHHRREPGEDRQILRGAHARHAGAVKLRAIGGDRDQLERGQRVGQRHGNPRMAVGVERDMALPQDDGLEILAVEA